MFRFEQVNPRLWWDN